MWEDICRERNQRVLGIEGNIKKRLEAVNEQRREDNKPLLRLRRQARKYAQKRGVMYADMPTFAA